MKRKTVITLIITLGFVVIGAGTMFTVNYNRYSLVSDSVTIELGEDISSDVKNYVVSGNKKAIEGTDLDFSDVDLTKAGTYTATATYGDKVLKFDVIVDDSKNPTVTLKQKEGSVVVGSEVSLADYVEKAEDLGGVKKFRVYDNGSEVVSGTTIEELKYTVTDSGKHDVVLEVVDTSSNSTEKEITINAVKDYMSMVTGFKDWSVVEGGSADFMKRIEKTDEVVEVVADSSGVDLSAPGEYTLVYTIKGDDGVTELKKEVKVTVTKKKVAVKKQSSGGSSGGGSGSAHTASPTDPPSLEQCAGMTVGEYYNKYGCKVGVGSSVGISALPDDYVLGSHLVLTFTNGETTIGP